MSTLTNGSFYGGIERTRTVGGLTLAETGYEPGFTVPTHDHAHPFFCLTLRGTFTERFERRSWTGRPATVFYHPAGAPHAEEFGDRGGRLFNIQLGGEWLDRLGSFEIRPPGQQLDTTGGRFAWLAGSLYREFRHGDAASDLAIDGHALALLAHVVRAAAEPKGQGTRPGWLDRVESLLHDRMAETLDVAGIATEVDIHPVHVARVFRRHHGCSPGTYLRRIRVRRACDLLTSGDAALSEIAYSIGFADQSHFTRSFRRETGVTPGEYRRLVRS